MRLSNPFSRVRSKKEAPPIIAERPLMAIYGWLGEVSKTDALNFASGLAAAHATNADKAQVYVVEFEGGYAYEVQEGTLAKPYLPSILEALTSKTKGDFVYLSTARRLVRIDRDLRGISSVWMPESENEPTSEGLAPHKGLTMPLAVPDAAGWLRFGSVILVLGVITAVVPVIAFSITLPLLFSGGRVSLSPLDQVPLDRWPAALQAASEGKQVRALEMVNGKWEVRATGLTAHGVPVLDTAQHTPEELVRMLPGASPPAPQPQQGVQQ